MAQQQSPKRKVTLYFNAAMLAETQREALRQDRSISWIIQACWRLAKDDVRKLPGAGLPGATGATSSSRPETRGPSPRRAAH